MAATKQLNPAAPPFHRPRHLAPAPPPPAMATMLPYHAGAGACPPPMGAAFYFCAEFPFAPFPDHHHHHQFVQFPVLHQSPATRILRKRLVSGKKKPPPARVFRKGGVVPAKPSRLSVKSSGVPEAVSSPPTKVACESAVPDEPPAPVLPEDVGEPAPHGLPPHKLMTTARKQQQQQEDEVTTPVAAKDVAHAAPAPGAAARVARRRAERRSNRHRKSGRRDGAVVGPRGWTTAWAPKSTVTKPREVPLRAWTTWAPTSTFTKPREAPLSGKPPAMLGRCTTVMVRNIPNRLKGDEMIALLDEHCARANRVAGDVVSAYDVAYLPIDFR
ncbi:hypothetical protein PR202_ga06507 [Eleusine coracana subsp. coracana]|uniref:Uncharacterized protein n=1 Tax=Eleusine coracana subsp. coracana TaxID=191504 RepID=A0AAV5BVJ9_ELECO|nr:hypothetical protein PR202_ga06507 [Eleusine coracana subsp. coracana]